MPEPWERRAIVSGLGLSRIGRHTGIGGLALTEESCRQAVADAGLTLADVDGLATMGDTPAGAAERALGLDVGWRGGATELGGLFSPVIAACRAVAEGKARHVLVYRTVEMMGGSLLQAAPAPTAPAAADEGTAAASAADAMAHTIRIMGDLSELITQHAYAATNWLAMHARRHMHLYGTTREQLGWLAVNSRRNAGRNPKAVYRQPITMDDYLSARMISDPLGLLDCDVPIDGSVALVVSTTDYAADAPKPAVRFNAVAGAPDPPGGWVYRADYPKMASADAAAMLWSRTELTPADVDIAELYDGFTILTLAWLEALGLCGEGESGPFVEGGQRIALDGELPLNTYGGQLSAGRLHGYWVLHEACTQLRGEAGERQVARNPEVAVVSNGGGPIAGCMLFTR